MLSPTIRSGDSLQMKMNIGGTSQMADETSAIQVSNDN